ncbi:hypothetical protein EDD17DRAFT_1648123 [Pisolithus thermaeus]|nr:hypothetical protein EDD17DRAFT_1648123 [Pisolithus thermaeus]
MDKPFGPPAFGLTIILFCHQSMGLTYVIIKVACSSIVMMWLHPAQANMLAASLAVIGALNLSSL